jgi:hypothetical protein
VSHRIDITEHRGERREQLRKHEAASRHIQVEQREKRTESRAESKECVVSHRVELRRFRKNLRVDIGVCGAFFVLNDIMLAKLRFFWCCVVLLNAIRCYRMLTEKQMG